MVPPTFLQQVLEEQFKSYVLMAYDYDGSFIVVKKINNPQEMDSMSTAFAREGMEFEDNLMGRNNNDDEEDDA